MTPGITITSSEDGTGNAVVSSEVRENFTGSARQASGSISGNNHTIVQDGGLGEDCGFTVSPTFQSVPSSGGDGSINILSSERCAWQAISNATWITITSTSVGVGDGVVTYSVAPNPGGPGRKGTISIGDKVVAVEQKNG